MPLECVDAIAGQVDVAVRILPAAAGLSQCFNPDVGLGVHRQVAAHTVDTQLSEGVAGRGRLHLVVTAGIPDRSSATLEAEENLSRLLALNRGVQAPQVGVD